MILDTNALSAAVDGDKAVGDILRQQARACIPVIVLGEFRYGIALSRHRAAYEEWLKTELDHFEVLAVTAQTTTTTPRCGSRSKSKVHHYPPTTRGSPHWPCSTSCRY